MSSGETVEANRRMEEMGRAFEEFVSTTAHNMREPLRDVAAYSELLAEKLGGTAEPEVRLCLDRIQEGAALMQLLLSDVVDYWAIQPGEQSSPIQMEAVLRRVLLLADEQIVNSGAVVTHDSLPQVLADEELTTKALAHLVRNAIGYCVVAIPRIHISCRRVAGHQEFSVRDNGPGIDAEFHERIFGAFKRLHGRERPGNGLGLAFCKRAMEQQGGKIWVESVAGEGSTFFFTLPCVE